MMQRNEIHIALIDDHSLFRNGLKSLIDGKRDCRVVAEFADGESFLHALPQLHDLDLAFMDISMPGINGDEATRKALETRPDLRIIALTMFGEREYYTRMIEAGAKGFLLKDSDIGEVFSAISAVMEDNEYISQPLLDTFATTLNPTNTDTLLSEREIDVLTEICRGESTQQIADRLFISKRTVDAHRANILEKPGCNNTASLVVYAVKHHLIEI